MAEPTEKAALAKIGEPDRFEVMPGLILEDKLRIKTQRRLEKHFKMPILRIFPGKMLNKETGKVEKWEGADFNFLDNAIPLITIIAQQVDEGITEEKIEQLFDSVEDEGKLAKNLEKYFKKIRPKGKPKNSPKPSRKRK